MSSLFSATDSSLCLCTERSRPPNLLNTQRQTEREREMAPASANRGLAATTASAVVAVFALTATNVVKQASGHPNCIADFAPSQGVDSTFCPNDYDDGFCCNVQEEAGIQVDFEAGAATGRCAEMHQEVRGTPRTTAVPTNCCCCVGELACVCRRLLRRRSL